MSKRVLIALSLSVFTMIPLAMAGEPLEPAKQLVCQADAERRAPIQVAQASACRTVGQSCGNQVVTGNSACCNGLVCANGACANFRRANEACGAGVPPCMAGLTCQAGVCR